MTNENKPTKRKMVFAYLFLLFTLLAFSSIEVISKPLMGKVDPFFMTAFRFLIGGLFLMVFVKQDVELSDLLPITLVGTLNSVVSMTSLQLAVKYSNASTAATLVASNPIFVSLFAAIMLNEKYRLRKYVGIGLGFVGIIVFSLGKISGDSWTGIFFGVLAALTFGLYTVLMRKYTKKYSPVLVTAYSSLCSSLIYVALLVMFGRFEVPVRLGFSGWLILIYLGLIVTGVAYLTYFKAMETLGATQSSKVFFLKPIVATIFAMVLLGESLSVFKIIGMIIVFISLSL
ncbi:Threonine/homoserine efflux transporter RhtA [Fervidobacterium changbaicum]|uniref:DMT family transporter n=2 Tax=Fervidobacterium TaxID=2422 RepID=A0AAI8CJZ0_FERIS|nr:MULTISPECIES: DMT family transporter [Fervidobacterium]AMW32785.1 DMT family transporter [Fervidobacterium islandicum]QAV32821.1 EamA family transporter [Fervidobacterium changbaicum]SDG94219.1 Threonine/homoserine efflux transporter RhtA [Fervidobacterium changbaicum]